MPANPKNHSAPVMAHADRPMPVTRIRARSTQPNEVDSIWYDSYRNLLARGVIRVQHPIAVEPQPFPNQFAPDPAG